MPPSEMFRQTHGHAQTQTHINTKCRHILILMHVHSHKQAKPTSSLQSQPKNAQTFNFYAQTIQNIITKENL